jgi:hypothetical protein
MRSKVRRKVFKKMYSFCGSKKGRNVGKKNSAQLDRVIDGQRKTENEVAFRVASLQRLEARGSRLDGFEWQAVDLYLTYESSTCIQNKPFSGPIINTGILHLVGTKPTHIPASWAITGNRRCPEYDTTCS